MNDPFHEPCPEPYPACVLSRFRWDRSSVMVPPPWDSASYWSSMSVHTCPVAGIL